MFFALQISQPEFILKVKKPKNRDENCSSNKHTMVNLDNIHLSEAEMDFENRTIRKRSPSNKAFLRNLSPSRLFNLCSSQQSTTNTFVQSCEGNSQLLKLAEVFLLNKKLIDFSYHKFYFLEKFYA